MSDSKKSSSEILKGLGYTFNGIGKLVRLNPETKQLTNQPFEFKISDDSVVNQKHYEEVGEVVTKYIYHLLESHCGLHRLLVPRHGGGTFIYVTSDAFSNENKLLILVQGSGVVRAGQWARSLIINDSLESGSQLPYIERAKELGYAVMVLNPNENTMLRNGIEFTIEGSENPIQHVDYVWNKYVDAGVNAQQIVFVAHSFGGVAVTSIAVNNFSTFKENVVAVALTDSVHDFNREKIPQEVRDFLKKVGRNWVTSDLPLDTPIGNPSTENEIPRVSAGHTRHEMTSWSSFDSVMKFLESKVKPVPVPEHKEL